MMMMINNKQYGIYNNLLLRLPHKVVDGHTFTPNI